MKTEEALTSFADGENDYSSNVRKQGLNYLNFLNLVAFIINVVFTYGIGIAGWGSFKSNSEVSDKYQTIITPVGWAFSIWSVIFLTEGIFCIIQLFSRFRSKNLVQKGVYFWFILACLLQSAWTFAFGAEIMWLSLVIILLIGISLVTLVISQYAVISKNSEEGGLVNYWLLRFGFEVHCGWILAASILNCNVLILDVGFNEAIQISAGVLSLGVLLILSTFVLYFPSRPNYVVPLVLAWASGGISSELSNPKASVTDRFGMVIVDAIEYSAASISISILFLTSIRLLLYVLGNYFSYFSCFGRNSQQGGEVIHETKGKTHLEEHENNV